MRNMIVSRISGNMFFKRLKNDKAELHIAGRFTAGNDCLRAIRSLAIADRVVSHGELNREGVRRLLYDCDCLVLATRSEAQPLVLLEAMSTGIPMISTEVVPRSERISGACYIVPVDDADSLASAMLRMTEHYSGASVSLSHKIAEMCSPQTVGQRIASVLEAATLKTAP